MNLHALRAPGWLSSLMLIWALSMGTASAQEVTLGQVGPFTGFPEPNAMETGQGIQALIGQANRSGGVLGKKLGYFQLDDGYTGDGFAERFKEAAGRKPLALISPLGSPQVARLLGDRLLDSYDIVVVNAIPGAESFRNPGHPRLFHVRAGDGQQIEKIITHAKTLGMNRLAVVYQDLAVGTSGWKVAEHAGLNVGMQMRGIKAVVGPGGLPVIDPELAKDPAEGFVVLGAPPFMAQGVAALRKVGIKKAVFVLSYVPAALLIKLAGVEGARGVGIVQTFPDPNGTQLPVVREFQSAMRAMYPNLTTYTTVQLEGYLSARVVSESLKRSKPAQLTPATLERALRQAGEMDFGGFRVDFSQSNAGGKWVDIAVIDSSGKLRY